MNNRPGMSEAVVWRGSTSRSEWVPLAPWATVCLPASCDAEARLESTNSAGSRSVALEDVVREVRYYEDPRDLFENHVQPGKFHVVYPDPQMRGCQEVYEDCPYEYELEFSDGDPVQHWWTAAVLARVHSGPYHFFVSFIIDEIGTSSRKRRLRTPTRRMRRSYCSETPTRTLASSGCRCSGTVTRT
ncbi:hypothetical protein ACFQRB_16230 [Halobaculum litoreum]|uniref:Uncharacterized protein n=1 Tax=Halobaculum litoreum TaxID=3031998 RepID=A0ABD5XR46_9EURY